ncbi:glycosyltransferase family 4 protein [Oxynema sp. CENA135]|uniref:glycosyltransferase family 4 protein n=1 Tax=Oxynema sp. CENA135 TaxID=984206 RepID=UPI00190C4706|nr:glycosyltransferase family 4 protein [Oxynema sp. CENA135]MBK4730681.1 glycosyltransferase family 4 protein [Oxynema sp. CENA135]
MPSVNPPDSLKLLFVSTPVGPLGSGLGGGVELTLRNIATELQRRGHHLTILAPEGSDLGDLPIAQIPGELQPTAQTQGRQTPVTLSANSVLANLWEVARSRQSEFDLICNFAYDWLPFYLTPFFQRPIAHLVSMGSLSDVMDEIIERVAIAFPGSIGVHSRAQAETFSFGDRCRCLFNGFDFGAYEFCETPDNTLAWVGRISPEKGLEDAVAASQKSGIPLKIFGYLQDKDYWHKIRETYPDAAIAYCGFLETKQLQRELGRSRALLVTPRWVEAFGNVVVEALACGVPAIAYRRGGPAEIVIEGETGWLVEPDSVEGLVEAISQLDRLDRRTCRDRAEGQFSVSAMGDRMEKWFDDLCGEGGVRIENRVDLKL